MKSGRTPSAKNVEYNDFVREEAAAILRRGSLWAMVLGFGCGIALLLLSSAGTVQDIQVPTCWSFYAGAFSALAYVIGWRGATRGAVLYFVVIGYALLPTVLLVMAQILLPSGAATYINGPPVLTYFVVLALSGFTLQPRLSMLAATVAAGGYAIMFAISAPALAGISHPDPLLAQDLKEWPFYYFKAGMIFFGGVMTAVLSQHARRLLTRVLEKDRERDAVHRAFGEYVSAEVRDRIIDQKGGAERLEVAVLFSDLRGFSGISEQLAPEMVVMHLNGYLDRMVEAITSNGGTVDKFIGDAVMAVFGGLLPLERPAESAVQAAFAMRAALADLNEEWSRVGLMTFDNGIGIHHGEVLMGTIGSRRRKEFTVIGDAVNVAARLEALTRKHPSPVLISDAVHHMLLPETAARFATLGRMTVKGRTGELTVFGGGIAGGGIRAERP